MSDLISRSKLLKEIEVWGGCVEALHEYISNMPTAYDVEKVVAELEEEKCKTVTYKDKYAQGWNNGTANAIYIVRKGGVE